jgi:hypothetical protein
VLISTENMDMVCSTDRSCSYCHKVYHSVLFVNTIQGLSCQYRYVSKIKMFLGKGVAFVYPGIRRCHLPRKKIAKFVRIGEVIAIYYWSALCFIAEARVRALISPCGICGGESGSGTGFFLRVRIFPVNIIPPWLSYIIWGTKSRPQAASGQRHRLTPSTWTTNLIVSSENLTIF